MMKNAGFNIFVVIFAAVLAWCSTPLLMQNDVFYSIKTGELTAHGVIDMRDHFSWLPLPYSYPHWAFDAVVYFLYSVGGFMTLYLATIALCFLLYFAVYLIHRQLNGNSIIAVCMMMIVATVVANEFAAMRAQMLTYVLLLFTVFLLERFIKTGRLVFGACLLAVSAVIANVHAAVWPLFFIFFLPYFTEYTIAKSSETKVVGCIVIAKDKNVKYLIFIALFCVLGGCFSPNAGVPFDYLPRTLAGTSLQYIAEHKPLTLFNSGKMQIIVLLYAILFLLTNIKIRLKDALLLFGLTTLALAGTRHVALLAIIGLLPAGKMLAAWLNENPKTESRIARFALSPVGKYVIALCLIVLPLSLKLQSENAPCPDRFVDCRIYPTKACDFILDNLPTDSIRLFNEYNFGSYLIFRNIRPFIDSRSDLYTQPFNQQHDILADYLDIVGFGYFYRYLFDEYGITHLLLSNSSPLNIIVFEDENFSTLYSDEYFTVYKYDKS
jgi:hypothetical protein